MTEDFDLVVIGAGPAGLAAATEGASHGLSTLLLDEQRQPGGQVYRSASASPSVAAALVDDYSRGKSLSAEMRNSAVTYVSNATVWDLSADRYVGYQTDGASHFVRGRRIVVATGALERPMPIQGWTLPGVMMAGAAQILLKSAGAIPSVPVVLAGTGPLLYLLALQLSRAGVQISALLDTFDRNAYWRAAPNFLRAWESTNELIKGSSWLREIRRSGIRHLKNVTSLRAQGQDDVREVVFDRVGKSESLPTRLLLLHQGVVPNIQIVRALQCEMEWSVQQLCWYPRKDEWGQTTVEGLYVAGDGGGIVGARAAETAGRLAALSIACEFRKIVPAERDRRARTMQAMLRRDRKLRALLDVLYRPSHCLPANDETIVCRCEEVTAGEVREAVRLGASGPNQAKAFVRCGMGPCQGRYCGLTLSAVIAAARGVADAEVEYLRLRPPFKPITLGSLARTVAPRIGADAENEKATYPRPVTDPSVPTPTAPHHR